jgi:hypothetical protein
VLSLFLNFYFNFYYSFDFIALYFIKKIKIVKYILILIAIVTFSNSFAQSANGFYAGAHLGINNIQSVLEPKLLDFKGDIGYMHGQKIRHNIQLTNITAGLSSYYKMFSVGLSYQLDILLVQKKESRFYIAPFVNFNFSSVGYKSIVYPDSNLQTYGAYNYGFTFGITPKYERKMTDHITLIASIPIQIGGKRFSKFNGNLVGYNNQWQTLNPSIDFNLGFRYNFKKSK